MRLAAVLLIALAAPAHADLADEADLNAGLRVIAAGNYIRRACPDIEARRLRGIAYIRQLAQEARRRGYSDEAIRAYVDDEAAREVVKGRALAYLQGRGLRGRTAEEFCRVGRAEIAQGTTVGRLLRVR